MTIQLSSTRFQIDNLTYTDGYTDLLFTSTVDNAGDELTLTIGATTGNNYDWVYVTDGAGYVLLAQIQTGTMDD